MKKLLFIALLSAAMLSPVLGETIDSDNLTVTFAPGSEGASSVIVGFSAAEVNSLDSLKEEQIIDGNSVSLTMSPGDLVGTNTGNYVYWQIISGEELTVYLDAPTPLSGQGSIHYKAEVKVSKDGTMVVADSSQTTTISAPIYEHHGKTGASTNAGSAPLTITTYTIPEGAQGTYSTQLTIKCDTK